MPTHTHPSPIDALIAWARAIRSREFLDANRTVADRFAEGLAGAGLAGTSFADLFALAQSVCVPPEALPDDLRSKDSVYLVITTRCNNGVAMRDTSGGVRFETCAHCLNGSGPHGASMSFADVDRVVANLPDRVREIEISGGEVLHPDVLPLTLHTLRACSERFGDGPLLSIQTNGDFLRSPRQSRRLVAELIAHGLRRIVVASMDIYHGRGRSVEEKLDERKRHYARIAENLKRESVVFVGEDDFGSLPPRRGMLTAHFFGADVEKWFGGFIVDDLVPNARAVRTGVAVESASGVRFCDHHAGAQGFLGSEGDDQIAVNGGPVTPCCWMTEYPLGDARQTPVPEMLFRYVTDPLALAQHLGDPSLTPEIASLVSPALGSALTDAWGSNALRSECVACRAFTQNYVSIMRDAGYPAYDTLWRDIPVPWNHRTDPEYDVAFASFV